MTSWNTGWKMVGEQSVHGDCWWKCTYSHVMPSSISRIQMSWGNLDSKRWYTPPRETIQSHLCLMNPKKEKEKKGLQEWTKILSMTSKSGRFLWKPRSVSARRATLQTPWGTQHTFFQLVHICIKLLSSPRQKWKNHRASLVTKQLGPKNRPTSTQSCRNHLLLATKPTGSQTSTKKRSSLTYHNVGFHRMKPKEFVPKTLKLTSSLTKKHLLRVGPSMRLRCVLAHLGKTKGFFVLFGGKATGSSRPPQQNEPKMKNGTRRLDAGGHVGSNLYSVKSDVFSI